MAKTSPVALAFVLFTALFLVGYWFLVLPQLAESGNVQTESQSLAAPSVLASPRPASAKQQAGSADDQARLRAAALTLLPAADGQYDLSVQVEALSHTAQVVLSTLAISQAPSGTATGGTAAAGAPAGISKITLSVTVVGPYQNVQSFIVGLTRLSRFVQVDQVSISGGGNGQISAQINAFAYYLPAGTAAAAH